MAGDAVARVRAALVSHRRKIEGRKADDFMAQCPAHGDGRPSLHVSQGGIGAVLNCFAGCSADAIVSALALTMADLRDGTRTTGEPRLPRYHKDSYDPERPVPPAFTDPDEPVDDETLPWAPASPAGGDTPGTHTRPGAYQAAWWAENGFGDPVAEYPYVDASGVVRVVVVRTAAKDFPCYVPATRRWSLGDNEAKAALTAIPYNLPALAADGGVRDRVLFVVEGEKDVHALAAHGLCATTRLGSSGEWGDDLSTCLSKLGASQVVVIEDRDREGKQAGAKKAANACESLRRVFPADVPVKRILLPPVVNDYRVKDAADYFAAGGTRPALKALVDAAPAANAAGNDEEADKDNGDGGTPVSTGAPHFASADLYGPLGEWVRTWEPHTEATPVALYATALAALGAMIGRGAYLRVNADQHAPRLFVLLVGPSGRGRKGVTMNIMRSLVREVDPDFARACEATGLSTTEGFINRLRDETPARLGPNGKEIPPIAGVTDKRLLVIEEEAGGLLKVMRREGNDLSATLRTAWDGRTVQRITKGDPTTATDPHLVFIGAITPNELREQLRTGDVFNGFANRLLPIYADAGTLLPFAETPDPYTLTAATAPIREAVRWARAQRGELHLSPDARVWWAAHYPQLVRPNVRSEALRVLQERAAPYVLRVALLLALLDRSRVVQVAHLTAAHALWQYAAGTWGRVFPDGARGGIAGRFEEALRKAGPDGLSRTELWNVLPSHNVNNADVTAALRELMDDGLIERIPSKPTRGRPAEQWRHVWCAPPGISNAAPDEMGNMGKMGVKSDKPPMLFEPPGDSSHHSHSSHLSPESVDEREGETGSTGDTSHVSHRSHVPTLVVLDESLAAAWEDAERAGAG